MKHKLNPVLDAQLNRNRSRRMGHRRNLSDGGHIGEDVSRQIRYCWLVALPASQTSRTNDLEHISCTWCLSWCWCDNSPLIILHTPLTVTLFAARLPRSAGPTLLQHERRIHWPRSPPPLQRPLWSGQLSVVSWHGGSWAGGHCHCCWTPWTWGLRRHGGRRCPGKITGKSQVCVCHDWCEQLSMVSCCNVNLDKLTEGHKYNIHVGGMTAKLQKDFNVVAINNDVAVMCPFPNFH